MYENPAFTTKQHVLGRSSTVRWRVFRNHSSPGYILLSIPLESLTDQICPCLSSNWR